MLDAILRNPGVSSEKVRSLRTSLDQFYNQTQSYVWEQEVADHGKWFSLMDPWLNRDERQSKSLRVLELGAGRSTFCEHIKSRRDWIEYHVQDITDTNLAYLSKVADGVTIGDVSSVKGTYDIVFSTFVFEHVSAPSVFLEQVDKLLKQGGIHFLVCPRYDFPGYVCPSLRHLSRTRQLVTLSWLACSRIATRVDRQPRFWINTDPAVFHRPWFRDADAVHIVSRFDVERWHVDRNYEVHRLLPPYANWREWFYSRHMVLALACTKKVV